MADHGTNARWMEHKRDGEDPCPVCKAGRNAYYRHYRESGAARRANQRYRHALQVLRDRHYPEYLTIMLALKEADDATEHE